jgi:hypothetical protein
MEHPSRRGTCFSGVGAMSPAITNRVERLDLFLNAYSSAITPGLFWAEVRIESIH